MNTMMIKIETPRGFRRVVLAACLFTFARALPALAAPAEAGSPHVRLHPPALAAARWTGGFWGDRVDLVRAATLDAMEAAMRCPTNGAQLVNFEIAGVESAKHVGNNWSDGDVYKWIESMARIHVLTPDPALDRKMDEWIARVARTQAADGYIGTQTQFNPEKERWGMRNYHELYNMGHLLTAAAVHHQASGKTTLLNVAVKCADYLYRTFQPRPKELAHFGWNPSNIMGLVDLYRVTGDPRHLELSGIFVDMRGSEPWPKQVGWGEVSGFNDPTPGDQTQDRVALRKENVAVGHAVTGAYLYSGAADIIAETGETALLQAVQRIWEDISGRKMYITGGTGAYHHSLSVRHDRVHEAYGASYELPRRSAYNETCANIAHAMFSRRLLALTGSARYADAMERVLYNSMLSAMSPDGTRFFYTNPLERRRAASLLSNDSAERWSTWKCFCCPPSVARTVAGLGEWAWSFADDGAWVHLFGTGEARGSTSGGEVRLSQVSNYPWDGHIALRVETAPSEPFALRVRIPAWARSASLTVNGAPAGVEAKPGTYATIRREWKAGDAVELVLPMEPEVIDAHPDVESTRGLVAVMRGPLVYCVESADLPDGVAIDDVAIPVDAAWIATYEPNVLGGVTVLECEARALPPVDDPKSLYRRARSGGTPVRLRMIPYYAWCNRGPGDMSVWLPTAR